MEDVANLAVINYEVSRRQYLENCNYNKRAAYIVLLRYLSTNLKEKVIDGQLRPKKMNTCLQPTIDFQAPPSFPPNAWIRKFRQIEHDLSQFK